MKAPRTEMAGGGAPRKRNRPGIQLETYHLLRFSMASDLQDGLETQHHVWPNISFLRIQDSSGKISLL